MRPRAERRRVVSRRHLAGALAAAALALPAALLLTACGSNPEASQSRREPGRYNVILVSLDTLRADHLSLDGYQRETSPNLDRLARESVVFERAISQSSWTQPSHRALFQSRYVHRTTRSGRMLAEALAARGYRTAAFTGGGHVSAQFGFGRGFERYEEDRKGGFANAFPQVERWLSEVGDEPFFLFLHTYDIHAPYDPPPPFADYFYSGYQGPVEPQETLELVDRVRERKQFADGHAGPVELDAADRRRLVALYDGGIRYTDQYIGRLLADLEDNGLLDQTILIVLADHGEEFWDHDSLGHGHTIYQEQLRVPLLWRLPHARLGGRRVDAVVRLVDVAPTVLEALRFPPEASFEGESLLPLLRGEERQQRVAVSQAAGLKSVIDYPWKLIIDTETRQSELYNLAADPEEETSLASSEIAQLRRLKELLTTESGPRVTDEDRPGEEEITDELREQLKALGYLQ